MHVNKGKLEPIPKKFIFIGYPFSVKRYRLGCFNSRSRMLIIRRDVVFDESTMIHLRKEFILFFFFVDIVLKTSLKQV